MPFAAIATPLTLIALALPFLFCFAQAPVNNFWPMLASWGCGAVLAWLALARPRGQLAGPQDSQAPWQLVSATHLAVGLLVASLLASVIGLLQFFLGDPGLVGVQPSTLGQAVGNLRQRNQQASLISMGVLAVLWLVEHRALAAVEGGDADPPRSWAPAWRSGIVVTALALLASASAATASRTGALQWLLVVALLVLWPRAGGRRPWGFALVALVFYGAAAWALPVLLQGWSGVATEGLFTRFIAEQPDCTSRTVLWANVVHLIAQRPWTGWGWGELDYAHYVTLFPKERFCVLLDNAHNLPLHLAVELGLPAALLVCGGVLTWVARSRPWAERQPSRQLAWGLLAIVGMHSLLEFPLWYGPFQLVSVVALLLLLQWPTPRWAATGAGRLAVSAVTVAIVAVGVYAAWDFYRVSQLYKPLAERPPSLRSDTVRKVGNTLFFTDQVDFALLTTIVLTPQNAGQVFAVSNKLLHFSPEPRVIEPLIESARMMGLEDEAAFHSKRYRAAYPADYARWQEKGRRLPPQPKP